MSNLIEIGSAVLEISLNIHPHHIHVNIRIYNIISKTKTIPIVSRVEWGAQSPTSITNLTLPVPYVIIHHTYEPGACYSLLECSSAMRSIQNYHQGTQGWADIGYNFAVGGDGSIYEGRGWKAVGAHAAGYNSVSIGIVLIGDFVSQLPPAQQMELTKELIEVGVELGYISKEYSLIGHRQVRSTECPGDALFQEITTWDRFTPAVNTK
ncbi:Peptidoglycan-recognition protein LB [Papilio xuthus]|uniref:Peptidoglycan-recognition protein n=1 Tax=Papilio xuthus TaxID=66420 RepID=A0A0N1I4J1_PAPXU|nr:Peptidoglycan-recognition protein LB [Papilio xuthus]